MGFSVGLGTFCTAKKLQKSITFNKNAVFLQSKQHHYVTISLHYPFGFGPKKPL